MAQRRQQWEGADLWESSWYVLAGEDGGLGLKGAFWEAELMGFVDVPGSALGHKRPGRLKPLLRGSLRPWPSREVRVGGVGTRGAVTR